MNYKLVSFDWENKDFLLEKKYFLIFDFLCKWNCIRMIEIDSIADKRSANIFSQLGLNLTLNDMDLYKV